MGLVHVRAWRETYNISREVELGFVAVFETIVKEELVDAEMTDSCFSTLYDQMRSSSPGVVGHLVDAGMRKVGEHVGKVEPSHRQFRNDHFRKSRKSAVR